MFLTRGRTRRVRPPVCLAGTTFHVLHCGTPNTGHVAAFSPLIRHATQNFLQPVNILATGVACIIRCSYTARFSRPIKHDHRAEKTGTGLANTNLLILQRPQLSIEEGWRAALLGLKVSNTRFTRHE